MATAPATAQSAGAPKKMRSKSIGHYILGKTIGEGTFGKVKLGTHILTGEKVAVKILEKDRIVDVADVERVAREIHILKLIRHPHIIQLYEIIETPRQLYLIMEYASGGELFDYIVAHGRVEEKQACRFFQQILAGVEKIHRTNVVHRDLKPENLLLDEHQNIKIVDFGLSNTFQDGQLLKTACGSPCYAAPEMIAGKRYVPSLCDVWSCGVILFALICGYLPFEDQNTANLYKKILAADYQVPDFTSSGARDLIAGMLTTEPSQRMTIPHIRTHRWYQQVQESSIRNLASCYDYDTRKHALEEDVLEQLDKFGFPRDYALKCLQMNKHNHVTTTYYLLEQKKQRMMDRLMGHEGGIGEAFGDQFGPRAQSQEFPPEASLEIEEGAGDGRQAMQDRYAGTPNGSPSGATPRGYPTRAGSGGSGQHPFVVGWTQNASASAGTPRPQSGRDSPAAMGPGSVRQVMSQTPRTPGSAAQGNSVSTASHPSPRRRVPNPSTPTPMPGSATPRGPPMSPVSQYGSGNIPPRPSSSYSKAAPSPSSSAGGSLSARPYSARASSTQGASAAASARPSGSSTARAPKAGEVRRRPEDSSTASAQLRSAAAPGSARARISGSSGQVPKPGEVQPRVGGPPQAAWAKGSRASSASPEPSGVAREAAVAGATPLSARDAGRDEAMRSARGTLNVSCTSTKAPSKVLQEVQRALQFHRVAFRPSSAWSLRCQKVAVCFEAEIVQTENSETSLVRFKRVAGEVNQYKDLCSKVLAEMRI